MTFSEEQKNYLEIHEIMSSLEDTEEDESIKMMDYFQSSPEEKEALKELVYHHMNTRNTSEWEPTNGESNDCEERYNQLLDEAEMSRDMDAWEDAFACHQLFADNPWSTRNFDSLVNKRSEAKFWCEITNVGDSYHTAESDYGKIFLSKFLGIQSPQVGDLLYIGAAFQGFECARKTTLPWRAKYVSIVSNKE